MKLSERERRRRPQKKREETKKAKKKAKKKISSMRRVGERGVFGGRVRRSDVTEFRGGGKGTDGRRGGSRRALRDGVVRRLPFRRRSM